MNLWNVSFKDFVTYFVQYWAFLFVCLSILSRCFWDLLTLFFAAFGRTLLRVDGTSPKYDVDLHVSMAGLILFPV